MTLTDRQFELIEVALESAISVCAGFPPSKDPDPLAQEYLATLKAVRQLQKEQRS